MEAAIIEDVVKRLVGPIKPVGESHTDEQRFKNLTVMCELLENLLLEIDDVATNNKGRREASMHKAGKYAHDFITNNLGIPE